MQGIEFLASFFDTEVTTMLFTWFVLGAVCFGLSVLPRWQDRERARTATPMPAETLRKVA